MQRPLVHQWGILGKFISSMSWVLRLGMGTAEHPADPGEHPAGLGEHPVGSDEHPADPGKHPAGPGHGSFTKTLLPPAATCCKKPPCQPTARKTRLEKPFLEPALPLLQFGQASVPQFTCGVGCGVMSVLIRA